MGKSITLLLGAMLVSLLVAPHAGAEKQFITIGTGGVTGVYYPTGSAICRLVNNVRKEHGIRCSYESTGGSVYNLNTIREGKLDMGVTQSDWQFHAYNGSSKFRRQGRVQGSARGVLVAPGTLHGGLPAPTWASRPSPT